MEIWLYVIIGILSLIVIGLLLKIHLLRKSAKEIKDAFTDRLITNTNTLIDISCNDKQMRYLADIINTQLRMLRKERHRFQQGDTELKHAVTNISHDLRTPLTAICGYLELLKKEEKSEPIERYLDIIRNRTEMLKQLTEELFKYSIIISAENNTTVDECEQVSLNEVLEESMLAFYTALKERNITPNIQMPELKVCRHVNRSSLSRVFANLLNNSIKYSNGDLDITLLEDGEITFTNTASELTEVQVGKLFDRFYTVETAKKSTGLGLGIARALVEQMNGTMWAKYENNKLIICISLPDVNKKVSSSAF